MSKIFSHIFIDKIQDLAGYDLEIVKLLLKSRSNILFVGDPRQVTYLTHIERKYDR
ncbi:UvrD-helicase domain-containing protein [Paenibacillus sp. sgz302251]|uniref:UvrD-helicase domain-containing protein n=1 Tax=Paenibacillus sp. sgz302251 TaxID=3414493 RepID=UPI003C7D8600